MDLGQSQINVNAALKGAWLIEKVSAYRGEKSGDTNVVNLQDNTRRSSFIFIAHSNNEAIQSALHKAYTAWSCSKYLYAIIIWLCWSSAHVLKCSGSRGSLAVCYGCRGGLCVGPFVGLFVCRLTQKLLNRFPQTWWSNGAWTREEAIRFGRDPRDTQTLTHWFFFYPDPHWTAHAQKHRPFKYAWFINQVPWVIQGKMHGCRAEECTRLSAVLVPDMWGNNWTLPLYAWFWLWGQKANLSRTNLRGLDGS